MTVKPLTPIGRAERVRLPGHSNLLIPAKIDTGADTSSIWASSIREHDGALEFVLFGKGSQYYTGQTVTVPRSGYRVTTIANSFGHRESRYVVRQPIVLGGRLVRASFTLADRSGKVYPILIGRRLLKNKFVVDVAQGNPLIAEEKAELRRLHKEAGIDEEEKAS